MRIQGSAVNGGTSQGHIALPRAGDRPRAHVEPKRKPTGLDWSALKPACRSCGTRTSALNRDDQCRQCAPRPVRTSDQVEKRATPPRRRRQYQRPIGPRRPRGLASRAQLDEAAVISAYQSGTPATELARTHSTTAKTIRALLDRAGIERRDDRTTGSGGANALPNDTRAEVARLYAAGLSKAKVAARLGIGQTSVSRIMAADGVPARQRQNGRLDGAAPLKAHIAALGTTPAAINRWALDVGLLNMPKPGIPSRTTVDAWEKAHQ